MATYVNDLRLKEITTGDESGTWGTSTNTNLELIAEAFSYGTEVITTNADTHTTTIADGATDPGRSLYLKYTGTLDSACTITIGPNTVSKVWIIENGTSGSQDIIISQGSGANITIPAGDTKVVYSDGAGAGAAFFDAFASLSVVDLKVQDDLTVTGDIDVDGTTNLDVVDIDGALTQDGGAVFNETGADVDFRVESDTVDHALFVQGSDGNVGIGTSSPTAPLTVQADSGALGIQLKGRSSNDVGYLQFSNNAGSTSSYIGSDGSYIAFELGGTERARIDSSGNVGIGVSGPQSNLDIDVAIDTSLGLRSQTGIIVAQYTGVPSVGNRSQIGLGYGNTYTNVSIGAVRTSAAAYGTDDFIIATKSGTADAAPTERFRIDASGNVGIGESSPQELLHLTATTPVFRMQGGSRTYQQFVSGTDFVIRDVTATANRITLDSSGNVGIGLEPSYKLDVLNTTANVVLGRFTTTATAAQSYGPAVVLTNDPNDTTRYFFAGTGGATDRIKILSNGNIVNQNNSYTGISDEKLKENIVDAGSQWDDIKALRVRKYSFKEENASEPTQIGVIAQEVEAAGMSGLVYETADQDTAEDGSFVDTGEVTKTMKYSILYMKAVKALQEAMTRIETLEARITTLENA
jgi:hypothetical protein